MTIAGFVAKLAAVFTFPTFRMQQKRNILERISTLLLVISLAFTAQSYAMAGVSGSSMSKDMHSSMQMDRGNQQMDIMDCGSKCPSCFHCGFAIPFLPVSLELGEKEVLLDIQQTQSISYSPFRLFRPPRQ